MLMESWFRLFTRAVIRGAAGQAQAELGRPILDYLDHYHRARAQPCRGTYPGQPLRA